MLIGVGTDLPVVFVHLYHAVTIPHKERKEEDKSVGWTVSAVHYKRKRVKIRPYELT